MNFATWTQGVYLLTSIFGIGVTVIDLLGILGGDDSHGDADAADLGDGLHVAADVDADADLDVGDGAAGDIEVAGSDLTPVAGHGEMHHSDSQPNQLPAGDEHSPLFATSFVVLKYLRRAVYFSLGFGPVGLVAISSGSNAIESLIWAIPCGIGSALLAGWVFNFQRRDIDSSVTSRDLFFQRAKVLVPISRGGMGKVRVSLGQSIVDRYARAYQPQESFGKGEEVCITRVTEECVYVEAFSPAAPGGKV